VKSSFDAIDYSPRLLRAEFAFPNSDNLPSGFPQRAIDKLISRNIPLELRQPELEARLWGIAEFEAGVPVPQTAIDANSDPPPWKYRLRINADEQGKSID
jgi:hypothetical protein